MPIIFGHEVKRLMAVSQRHHNEMLEDVLAFLSGRGENPVSGEDGLVAVRLCEACLESARSGTWVDIH